MSPSIQKLKDGTLLLIKSDVDDSDKGSSKKGISSDELLITNAVQLSVFNQVAIVDGSREDIEWLFLEM